MKRSLAMTLVVAMWVGSAAAVSADADQHQGDRGQGALIRHWIRLAPW
jgi:hypothetical protein